MPLEVSKTIDLSSNYAVYQHLEMSWAQSNPKMPNGLFGYSNIAVSNTSHVNSKIFSIEYFRQSILESLSPYFNFVNQRTTLSFICERQWLVESLLNCYEFIASHIENFQQISLDYQEDIGTLYLNVHFETVTYNYISSFRDKFFDFIITHSALFDVLNISFSSDEV